MRRNYTEATLVGDKCPYFPFSFCNMYYRDWYLYIQVCFHWDHNFVMLWNNYATDSILKAKNVIIQLSQFGKVSKCMFWNCFSYFFKVGS